MAGLGPAIHPLQQDSFLRNRWMRGSSPIRATLRSSLPGLTRQFIDLRKNFLAKKMDARVKPAHDELAKQLKLAPMGTSPRMTWIQTSETRCRLTAAGQLKGSSRMDPSLAEFAPRSGSAVVHHCLFRP